MPRMRSPAPIKGLWPIENRHIQSIYSIQSIVICFYALFLFRCLCHALAVLGFGRIFAVLSWKTVGSPPRKWGDLCCFARKVSVCHHESTTTILVFRGSFACQHILPNNCQHSSVSALVFLGFFRNKNYTCLCIGQACHPDYRTMDCI
jgi:hypothetical protein